LKISAIFPGNKVLKRMATVARCNLKQRQLLSKLWTEINAPQAKQVGGFA
jgi:hypothetical protein